MHVARPDNSSQRQPLGANRIESQGLPRAGTYLEGTSLPGAMTTPRSDCWSEGAANARLGSRRSEQRLPVIDHLGDRLGPLGPVVADQRPDRPLSVDAVLSPDDLVQRLAGTRVDALGQRAQDIGDLMDPTPLFTGLGEHLPKRPPQPQRAVAHHDHRRTHAAPAQVPQQLRPRVAGLPLSIGDRHQLLGAVGAHPHDHQAAQPPVLQPQVEVDAVSPAVHVVPVGQAASQERRPLGLPLDGQPGHHRRRQASRGAEEPLQRRHEVQARQPMQVQQRQHLGHLGAAPTPAGQDHALELHPLTGSGVGATVVHPRADHLDLTHPGGQRATRSVPVADHQPVAVLIDQLGVRGDVGLHLGLQRCRQHPPGTSRNSSSRSMASSARAWSSTITLSIAAFLPRRRSPAGVLPTGQGGRYAALSCQGLIHKFRP